MMKKILLLSVAAGILIFQSCKEVGPLIDGVNAPEDIVSEDTTYTITPEAPQAKIVLAEEFTGVSCPNCPDGKTQLDGIKANLNGNMIIIAYHIENNSFTDPVTKDGVKLSKYDFRTPDATQVLNEVFKQVSGMPEAGMDRIIGPKNVRSLGRADWANAAEQRSKEQVPVNIYLTSTYDETAKEATVKVKLIYNSDVNMRQHITLAVLEDSIVDAQTFALTKEKEYVHEHVMRDIVTPAIGTPIPDKVDPKVPGRVYERTFKVPVLAEWHVEHLHLVAFVHNNEADNKLVVQAAEVKLTGE